MANKKATSQVGIGIIVMALLLLLGGIFVDDGTVSKSSYLDEKKTNGIEGYPEESYLFYLNETDIGRQKKVTESFPNVELGSKIENNIIFLGNDFKLKANPFTNNAYSFNVNFEKPEEVNYFMLYFNPNRITGKQDLVVKVDDVVYYENQARNNELPIVINKKLSSNQSSVKVSLELRKPQWYQIFNWNSYEVKELKVNEVRQNKANNLREYDFEVNKLNLERVELNVVISCENTNKKMPIKIKANDYIIEDFTPECTSNYNRVTREIPLNILNSQQNRITFETEGYYKVSYSFNKIYFNDQDTYKFTIGSFNDIIDVVMYGDFDKDVIDLKINDRLVSLGRDEIMSIIPYLRFGTNEIEFVTKPVEIKEFVIEKSEFLY